MKSLRTLILFVLLATPASLNADPLVVTSGQVNSQWDSFFSAFFLNGNDFQIGGSTHTRVFVGGTLGEPTSLSGTFPVEGRFVFHPSFGTFNGERLSQPNYWTGSLLFSSPAFVPVAPAGESTIAVWTAPFTMTGTLSSWTDTIGVPGAEPRLTIELMGQGTATANHMSFSNGQFFDQGGTVYQFEDPAAVPEPASAVLFGFGMALVAHLRRRKSCAS